MSRHPVLTGPALFLLLLLWVPTLAQRPLTEERGTREKDPVMTADGSQLYFTRPDHPRNQGTENGADVWIRSRQSDGRWGRALNPGSPINSFANDRVLCVSPGNDRLAVLRTGTTTYIDLLERSGRSWRVLDSWQLPEDLGNGSDLTFNPNSHRLIYSRAGAEGSLDLYTRTALANGHWTDPEPLHRLNASGNERYPILASDGRTLYFRRDGGQWYRQTDRGAAAERVEIPARYLQFAVACGSPDGVVMTDDLGHDEKLLAQSLPMTAVPPAAQLVRGTLGNPPAPGERTVEVPLNSGTELEVRPDPLQRYAVMLRPGEAAFPAANLPPMRSGERVGSLAGTNTPAAATDGREQYLRSTLAARERDLAELDRQRRASYLTAEAPDDDPERAALRHRLININELNGDTLPPATTTRDRYAQDLTELERMKEKFRQQQEARLRNRDRGGRSDHDWTARQPATTQPATTAPATYDRYRDSLGLRSSVQSGLYPDQRPAPYEATPWEKELQRELPRQGRLSPEEAASLDAEYTRRMREVEALRAQLRQAQDRSAVPPSAPAGDPSGDGYPPNRQWSAKSPSAPTTYGSVPAAAPPASVTVAGVEFIPNTAYPNSVGYEALDVLVLTVRRAVGTVEIRVHTARDLDPRSAQLLSEERAAAITDHLREAGVDPAAFRVIGYGNNLTGDYGERVEILRQ